MQHPVPAESAYLIQSSRVKFFPLHEVHEVLDPVTDPQNIGIPFFDDVSKTAQRFQ